MGSVTPEAEEEPSEEMEQYRTSRSDSWEQAFDLI